jgi:branched-chain amino acid transport system ATP-binding protein
MKEALVARGLIKRFRGLTATDNADLTFFEGELHALIGPNGAGKTTLINLLSGELTLDAGSIVFQGRDITRLPTHQRALAGLVRSFQITSVFPELTALQNVMLAVQAAGGHSFSFLKDVRTDVSLTVPALEALKEVGLLGVAHGLVMNMAHGARRQLELAMVLALKPRVMLLDEPLAGMSGVEADAMVALLSQLKERYTIVIVEHDMDAVFSLADRLTVLTAGRPIATGTAAEIRTNQQVKVAYLGDEDMVA